MPIITLTTDFGMRDPYVAAMKGMLRQFCPNAVVDDLTHDIAPQDVLETALFLEAAVPWYPENTVHLVVVDPGVGTARRPVEVRAGGHFFVAPDNGLLSLWLGQHEWEWAYEISPLAPGVGNISNTFHGRDIFAPAAAWLANGGDPHSLGEQATCLQQLEVPIPAVCGDHISGVIMHIDRFGNCITNIRREDVEVIPGCKVHLGESALPLCRTYGDVAPGVPLALFGSSGRLEIAVNQGNAARLYTAARMMEIKVVP